MQNFDVNILLGEALDLPLTDPIETVAISKYVLTDSDEVIEVDYAESIDKLRRYKMEHKPA